MSDEWWVVDATGTTGFLDEALAGRVKRFVFSQQSKTWLGRDFLWIVEKGRYREYVAEGDMSIFDGLPIRDGLQERYWRETRACEYRAGSGAEKTLQWGVPDRRRDAETGERLNDDLLVSAMVCAALEGEALSAGESVVLPERLSMEYIY